MPMGPAPAGFLYFVGVKFAGYSGCAHLLRAKLYDDLESGGTTRTLKIGGARTGIGIVAGIAYGFLALSTGWFRGNAGAGLYLLGLLPVRIAEWWLLLWLFFGKQIRDDGNLFWGVTIGIAVSYVLDAIGIAAAFVLPGGMWVC